MVFEQTAIENNLEKVNLEISANDILLVNYIKELMSLLEDKEELIHIIADKILDFTGDRLDKINLAIRTIQDTMEDNPENLDIKEGIIGILILDLEDM